MAGQESQHSGDETGAEYERSEHANLGGEHPHAVRRRAEPGTDQARLVLTGDECDPKNCNDDVAELEAAKTQGQSVFGEPLGAVAAAGKRGEEGSETHNSDHCSTKRHGV